MSLKNPLVSIIVRTYNEEHWITHCLKEIFNQDFESFEVILVDNNSNDNTVEVAKRYPISKVVKINKFIPGKALNDGIRASKGSYIVCISAHCIPKDKKWLGNLHANFKGNEKIAGVYGRQLPLSFTSDADKRDLLITFGQDRKIQIKDHFFHNANSMISRAIWDKFPFDEEATNIEDRIWGKAIIEAGYEIAYDPEASVYHHHGLHQHGTSSDRANGIARILEKLDQDSIDSFPESLKPENINVASILLVNGKVKENSIEFKSLLKAVNALRKAQYVNKIYVLSYDEIVANLCETEWIDRNKSNFNGDDINVENLLSASLLEIESTGFYPEVIVYVNHYYPFRPKNLFNELIKELQYKGLSSVFPGFEDYGHYWQKTNNIFSQIDSSMSSRIYRNPMMRALYGLGCATRSTDIRSGSITGINVGIISIDDYKFTLNIREKGSEEIIKKLL